MRNLMTLLLTVLAWMGGAVLAGYFGDQGRGVDVTPFVVGAAAAAAVLWLRRAGARRGRS